MYRNRENRGKIGNWLKKVIRNFGDETRKNFWEKVKFVKFSRVWQFFENREEIWNRGGKCIMASEGDGRPWAYTRRARMGRSSPPTGYPLIPLTNPTERWVDSHRPMSMHSSLCNSNFRCRSTCYWKCIFYKKNVVNSSAAVLSLESPIRATKQVHFAS